MINNKVAILTAMILVVGIVSVVGINTTFADSKKAVVNNCVVDESGKCDLKQFYKTKNGDIEVTNNIDVSAVMGGGNGNVSTVDQTARDSAQAAQDGVSALQNQDVTQDNNIGSLQAENAELRANIAELNATLQNAVIDIDVSTSPPVVNDTGNGNTTNGGGNGNTTNGNGNGNGTDGNITG